MGLIKNIINSFFIAVIFFIVIFIGDFLFPGVVLKGTFTDIGLLLIVAAIGLDALFNLQSLET